MINVVIFGPPGAGKGTQSKNIAEKYQLKLISTGDLLREECASGSELGKEIARRIDGGNFVPDEMILEMVSNFYKNNTLAKGFVLDGFPRNKMQSEWFDNFLAKHFNSKVDVMLSMEVEEEELIQRILKRGKDAGRPDDQDRETAVKRLGIYHNVTKVVKDHYQSLNLLDEVNGMGTIEEVFSRLVISIDAKVMEEAVC